MSYSDKLPPEIKKEINYIQKAVIPKVTPLFCLALINEKPRSGYDIIKETEQIRKELLEPSLTKPVTTSAIYPLLHDLEKKGLLTSRWDERRKIYYITKKGKKHLTIGKKLWKKCVDIQLTIYKKIFMGDEK